MGAGTLKDLAAKLGLSITTVSSGLSGYSKVAESTRQRVLAAADEMGYVPDVTARRLQKGRTDTLGFVIPTHGPRFSDPFFSELLAGMGNEASRHNFDLLVSTRPPDTSEEQAVYRRMAEGRLVDGMFVVQTRVEDWRIRYLSKIDLPFVSFGRSDLDLDFAYVDEDGRASVEPGCQAARHHADRIKDDSPQDRCDQRVCHARPGGSDEHGRSHCDHAIGRGRPGRLAR